MWINMKIAYTLCLAGKVAPDSVMWNFKGTYMIRGKSVFVKNYGWTDQAWVWDNE